MKLLLFPLLCFITVSVSAQDFVINTSRGERTVSVPAGYTIEEAFQQMASLYLEERWDHELTIEQNEELIDEIENYRRVVEQYRTTTEELRGSYADLQSAYEALRPPLITPYYQVGVSRSVIDGDLLIGSDIGLLLRGEWSLALSIFYPLRLGFSVGRVF